MKYSTKLKLFIALLLASVIFSRFGCYYLNKKYDTYRRPWAYSDDPSKPLLVGKWQGTCIDPDQISHIVEMEILLPTTDDERWKRSTQKRPKRDRSSTTFFNGFSILEANGKKDTCELWGGLDKADGHEVHFQFSPISKVHPPGFNLNLLKGNWQDNTIDLGVDFAWFRTDGSSFYNSEDPRHDTKGKLLLSRIK